MKPINVNESNFDSEVLHSEIPVLADFFAPWCGPCKTLAPVIEQLAEEYAGKVKVVKINTDESEQLAQKYKISSIPTLLILNKGSVVNSFIGLVSKIDIKKKLDGTFANVSKN